VTSHALALTIALTAGLLPQDPARTPGDAAGPQLTISEPAQGAFVSGLLTLRASVEPGREQVRRLSFMADGQTVCSLERPPFECPWDAGPGVTSHVFRAVAVLRDGRRLVANVRTVGARLAPAVEVTVVQVAASVTDGSGRFVRGLGRESFRILEDGVPQELSHFVGEGTARELVVAVDMSGSMGPAMDACRRAVKAFLGRLKPDDRLTLLAFNDGIFTVASRETDPAARERAVDRLAPWGGTALFDVVLRGLDLLERQRGRRALVLFTDGEDRDSHATAQDVERRVEVSAAPIYVIAQGKGTREKELKRVMDRLADVSGGRAFYTDRIDELAGVFAEITEDLDSQYLLAYDPTNSARDGSWRTIKVEIKDGAGRRVRARQGYRAAPAGR
jgi:Ca-activated chloride channel family protein